MQNNLQYQTKALYLINKKAIMKIRITKCSSPDYWYSDKIGKVLKVTQASTTSYLISGVGGILKADCEEIDESQIIDYKGIQTEVFTHEEKKVIAVEKDTVKCELWALMLEKFKAPNDLQRIALLEIFEEMGYPKTDMVKLYRKMQNEL